MVRIPHLDEYAIVQSGQDSVVLFAHPYVRFDSPRLDAYYLASNQCYWLTKRIVSELNEAGIEASTKVEEYFKPLAFRAVFGSFGANSLIYHHKFGSSFVIGAFTLRGRHEQRQLEKTPKMPCDSCQRCVRACPVNALEGAKFHFDRCIRAHIEGSGEVADNGLALAFGERVLGCDICQRACPLNSAATIPFPNELHTALDDVLVKNSVGALAPLIGANMARLKRLKNLVILAAGNEGRTHLAPFIEQASHQQYFKVNATRALEQLKGK